MSSPPGWISGGSATLSTAQRTSLVLLRILIGWHFLYEGWMKLTVDDWSAAGYLLNSRGPLHGFFAWLASGSLLDLTDAVVIWGLTLLGILLIVGLFSRWAALGAAIFLAMVYLANPPWPGINTIPGEGSFLIVDKNLVELFAVLTAMVFPTSYFAGLDLIFFPRRLAGSAEGSQDG